MAKGAKSKSKTDTSADPDKLVRQQAGTYRSTDERFEVREADGGWFLVDSAQSNEFGQELLLGPFPTLKVVREAIPGARESKPAGRGRAAANKPAKKRTAKREPPQPPPPPSWIDQLPKADAASVRTLITALEKEGITDAEALVRRDREGLYPAVAARIIERRIENLVADLPTGEQDAARELLDRVTTILSAEGSRVDGPLPGWALVEFGPEPAPPNRRIDLRR